MPSLVLFGRKTDVAGDDLRFWCLTIIMFRIVQLIIIIPGLTNALTLFVGERKCPTLTGIEQRWKLILSTYMLLSAFLAFTSITLEALIWNVSVRGTPTQPEERSGLKFLCFLKFVPMAAIRLLTLSAGVVCVWIRQGYCECATPEGEDIDVSLKAKIICPHAQAGAIALVTLLSTHCVDGFIVAIHTFYFCWKTLTPIQQIGRLVGPAQSRWKIFCRCCCCLSSILSCCFLGGTEATSADFNDISLILATFMDSGSYLDFTFSDLTAALSLLYWEHQERHRETVRSLRSEADNEEDEEEEDYDYSYGNTIHNVDAETSENYEQSEHVAEWILHWDDEKDKMVYKEENRIVLDPSISTDMQVIAEGARFIHLSTAIYGHLMYIFNHAYTGPCILSANCLACKRSFRNPHIKGDNPCGCNEIALLRETGLAPDCIAYASFHSGVIQHPYCIAVDHEWKMIVLAIRGTLTLEDMLSDITIRPKSLKSYGERYGFDGSDGYAHTGMVHSAEWIIEDLSKHKVLDRFFPVDSDASTSYQGYSIKVVGHSLGGGVAAIVAYFLKSKYPTLTCLCFDPPGCTFSATVNAQDFITSFVFGSDIVPRLSIHSIENLRDEALTMIARIKTPKYKIFAAKTHGVDHVAYRKDNIPPSDFTKQLANFHNHQKEKKVHFGETEEIRLFPPGKIVHFIKTRSKNKSSIRLSFSSKANDRMANENVRQYVPVWAKKDDFSEIQLSGDLVTDHIPTSLLTQLKRIAGNFGLEPPLYTYQEEAGG